MNKKNSSDISFQEIYPLINKIKGNLCRAYKKTPDKKTKKEIVSLLQKQI